MGLGGVVGCLGYLGSEGCFGGIFGVLFLFIRRVRCRSLWMIFLRLFLVRRIGVRFCFWLLSICSIFWTSRSISIRYTMRMCVIFGRVIGIVAGRWVGR